MPSGPEASPCRPHAVRPQPNLPAQRHARQPLLQPQAPSASSRSSKGRLGHLANPSRRPPSTGRGPLRSRAAQALSPMTPTTCSPPPRPTGPGSTSSSTTAPTPRAATTRSTASTARCWAGRLRLPLRDRQRHREPRRPDRGRPALVGPEARRPLPRRQERPTSTNTASASAWSATSTTRPPTPARSPPPGPWSPTSATATRSPPTHRHPRPARQRPDRLPRQVLPHRPAIVGYP